MKLCNPRSLLVVLGVLAPTVYGLAEENTDRETKTSGEWEVLVDLYSRHEGTHEKLRSQRHPARTGPP